MNEWYRLIPFVENSPFQIDQQEPTSGTIIPEKRLKPLLFRLFNCSLRRSLTNIALQVRSCSVICQTEIISFLQ